MRAAALAVVLAACAHAKPETITGGELYARLQPLRDAGATTIGRVVVRKDQILTTGADGQSFEISQVIEHCHGGDPHAESDCTLALLLDQRFAVVDTFPEVRAGRSSRGDRSGPFLSSAAVVGLALAVTGGLVYGIATCSFPGCKYVFGVPIVFVAGAALISISRD